MLCVAFVWVLLFFLCVWGEGAACSCLCLCVFLLLSFIALKPTSSKLLGIPTHSCLLVVIYLLFLLLDDLAVSTAASKNKGRERQQQNYQSTVRICFVLYIYIYTHNFFPPSHFFQLSLPIGLHQTVLYPSHSPTNPTTRFMFFSN